MGWIVSYDFFSNFQDIFYHFIKNPQTTIALTFLTHIISAIGGVCHNGVENLIKSELKF